MSAQVTKYFLALCAIILLVNVIDSAYHVYTYDDGNEGDEHCCLVRVGQRFCFATPVTRSLLRVDKSCYRNQLQGVQRKREKSMHLNTIVRRLNIQLTNETKNVIFIELKKPLEQTLIDRDLVCSTPRADSFNFNKCYVEMSRPHRKGSARQSRRLLRKQHKQRLEKEKKTEPNQMKITRPVHIREGSGVGFQHEFHFNFTQFHPQTRFERKCRSWYQQKLRQIQRNGATKKQHCSKLTDHGERCIHRFVHRATDEVIDNKQSGLFYGNSLTFGSKLFCENSRENFQLLGILDRTAFCIRDHNNVAIEYIFDDIASLTDIDGSKKTLAMIDQNEKFKTEFSHDCLNEDSLVEEIPPIKESRASPSRRISKTN